MAAKLKRPVSGIAFYGEPGAGKSTARDYMLAVFGARHVAFAHALRQELVRGLCGCNGSYITSCAREVRYMADSYDPRTKEPYIPLLQAWGAFRRWENPLYWVQKARDAIINSTNPYVVNDDLRYDNERQMLEEIGVVCVWVDGPRRSNKPMDHESEVEWRKWVEDDMEWGRYVRNHDTLIEYTRKLDALIRTILLERE